MGRMDFPPAFLGSEESGAWSQRFPFASMFHFDPVHVLAQRNAAATGMHLDRVCQYPRDLR